MSRSCVPSRSPLRTPLGTHLGNMVHLIGYEWVPRLLRYLVHNRFCIFLSQSLLRRSSFLWRDFPRQSLPFTITSLLPWGEPLRTPHLSAIDTTHALSPVRPSGVPRGERLWRAGARHTASPLGRSLVTFCLHRKLPPGGSAI